ncbi:MAG: hypothetical protein V4721_02605 [Bacteroidota bacterium]
MMYSKFILSPVVSFPVNIAALLLLVYTADTFILNADFYEKAVKDSGLNWNTVLLSTSPKFKLVLYTASALLLFLKYSLISLLIYTTFYLNEIKASYSSIFKIVCLAEMIFLVPAAIKVAWFFVYPPTGLDQWTGFYPLSIHSIVSGVSIPAAAMYPLQLLNLFELVYILSLAYFLQKLVKRNYDHTLRFVMISYLPGLIVWILLTSYYTLMIQPG